MADHSPNDFCLAPCCIAIPSFLISEACEADHETLSPPQFRRRPKYVLKMLPVAKQWRVNIFDTTKGSSQEDKPAVVRYESATHVIYAKLPIFIELKQLRAEYLRKTV